MKRTFNLNKPATLFAPLVMAIVGAFVTVAASSAHAHDALQPVNANDSECFPMCAIVAIVEPAPPVETQTVDAPSADACNNPNNPTRDLIKQAEQLNDRIKPIKDIVGYVRSPQGLAIKLVNDHVVKIPPWVGYAIDPIGSLKNRAMDEVRTRAKSAMGLNHKSESCAAETAAPIAIDAALIPIDTQQI